ncbi:MAG: DUF2911 domain-containing protein, partial [Gemmatimonadota bacterium]
HMRRPLPIALTAILLVAGCSTAPPTEQYGFLARLGQDTISVESVSRYPGRIVSEEVDRFPDVRQRRTEITLAKDGSPQHMDMRVLIPSAEARSQERRIVADFSHDEVRVSLTDGSGTKSVSMATEGLLTLPHVPQMYSLYELYFAAALAKAAVEHLPAGKDLTTHQFYPDREFSNYPNPMHHGYVRPGPTGTATIQHDWLAGTGSAALDSNRRMLSYSGQGTTYKVEVTRLDQPPDVATIGSQFAAAEKARGPVVSLSVRDTLRATIGAASFRVDYGRPLARGRTLLGDVISYDRVWRTGANAATQFTTSAPITVGGIRLAAGTYTLWTLPTRNGVSLIVNRQVGQWGTEYGPANDIGRTPLVSSAPTAPVEKFTISIEPRDAHAGVIAFSWGPFRWTAPVEVE